MMKKMMKGFTLAEVLTTLLVIGVVAALTIPALFNNTGERQYKAQYKKAVSVLENAISMINTGDYKCEFYSQDSGRLAGCFANEMKGTVDTDRGIIESPDGAAYKFYYAGPAATSLKDACGSMPSNLNSTYHANAGYCMVVVDLNGLDKGATEFKGVNGNQIAGRTVDTLLNDTEAKDQQVIRIFSDGVIPAYQNGKDNINRGFKWIYGDDATP